MRMGWIAVAPPKAQRHQPWEYDKELCRKRSQVERLFWPVKGWRRVFTPYGKLKVMFAGFIMMALIAESPSFNRPQRTSLRAKHGNHSAARAIWH